jgi:hypothetical protein
MRIFLRLFLLNMPSMLKLAKNILGGFHCIIHNMGHLFLTKRHYLFFYLSVQVTEVFQVAACLANLVLTLVLHLQIHLQINMTLSNSTSLSYKYRICCILASFKK